VPFAKEGALEIATVLDASLCKVAPCYSGC